MLGLSPAQVDLIENDVGGGFGARGEFYPEDFLIPFAARHVGRPVRWLENHRSPSNPLGVKGAGEGAIIPIGGLMANAVANALASFGAMPNQLPLSPARVWHMGSDKQSTRSSE